MCRTAEESKAINSIRGTIVIIAGSGMCTGGRIKHHLLNNIDQSRSTVLFVGYQANGTLGRIILEKPEEVRILGQNKKIRADIHKINGFSAHADQEELLRWLSGLQKPPRRVFVTHGEPTSASAFADTIKKEKGWNVAVPSYDDRIPLL